MNKSENTLPVLDAQLISTQETIDLNHNNYTFFVVLEGKFELSHDADRFILKTGDVYFMDHMPAGRGNIYAKSCLLMVSFAPEFMSQYIPAYPFRFLVNSCCFPEESYDNLIRLLMDISLHFFTDTPNHYFIMSLSYELLHELDKNFTVMAEEHVVSSHKHSDRIRAIASFVNKNYSLNITQSDMARHLYVSPQHCSRFFRQHFQMTFLEYLNYVRLQHALGQLQYSDLSITQIAFQNGFPNLYSFNRVFRQYKHTTPNEYRKRYIASQRAAIKPVAQNQDPDTSLQSLKHYEQLLGLLAPTAENAFHSEVLPLSTIPSHRAFPACASILNIGLLSDCLMYQFHVQVADLQSRLHFQYVRFHGILDDTVISQVPQTDKYNFQHADTLLDYFLELKLTPFIEIGNKPKRLSFALSPLADFIGADEGMPYTRNLEKLQPFLKHCIHRYGIQVVETWYFEIWMDFDQYFDTDRPEDALPLYIDHYGQCLKTIKALAPKAQVGGPGFNTVASFSILNELLKRLSMENLPMDFISAYLYPYEVGKNMPNKKKVCAETILIGPEQILERRVRSLISTLQRLSFQNKRLFITEYHFSVSPRNHMNDSCFQAAFILKTLLENEESIAGFGYFRSLDISSNYTDAVAPLYGGSGLITKDGINKPSYYAYYFLNSMKGRLLEKGDGYLLVQTSQNCYSLLLYYYLHPASEYLLNSKTYPPMAGLKNIFPNAKEKHYHITIDHMDLSQYIARHRFLNKDCGSVFDAWLALNATPHLSGADIAYLKNVCVPHQTISILEAVNQRLSFSVKLIPHEIRLIEITPAVEI
ncbi:MAG TPA: helix-turn-helix domain-containing protein [Clostridiales bacterium]|nr:helix-turn-helix domain-containing protein [Clostridiales bacterium]